MAETGSSRTPSRSYSRTSRSKHVSNAPSGLLGLPHDQSGGADRPSEETVPELVGIRDAMGEVDRPHLAILQAMLAQEGVELLVDREPEEVGSGGQILGGCCPGLRDCVQKHAEKASVFGQVPGRQGELATRSEHSHELGHRLVGTTEVQDQEIANHGVETLVERKRVRVRLTEVESGVQAASKGDHRRGVVHREHRGSPLGRAGRRVARAGGEIKQPRPRAYGCGVQERLDQMAGDPRRRSGHTRPPWLPSLRPQRR